MTQTNEAAFEAVIEAHLLANGYVPVNRDGFDRGQAIFPDVVLGFIRSTQATEWAKLEALHGDKTGEQILGDLCKWMDVNGSLATLRHGFKCYGRKLRLAFFKAAHELNPELETRYAANRLGIRVRDDLIINSYRNPDGQENQHKSYGYLRAPELSEHVAAFLRS